jgi:hypothetical protein
MMLAARALPGAQGGCHVSSAPSDSMELAELGWAG